MPRHPTPSHNLQALKPKLAAEWHPTMNGNLTPSQCSPHSKQKVWWLCKHRHEWQSSIDSRSNGINCPYCSNKAINEANSLAAINPSLAEEWHPNKNGSIVPYSVAPNSGKKVWWQCKKGHEWRAVIASRNKGHKCPFCKSKTSSLELRIYSELSHIFPNTVLRAKIYGNECDIYIPSLKLGIEVDGYYWHKNRHSKDQKKTSVLKKYGVLLVRLRESGLKKILPTDMFYAGNDFKFDLLRKVFSTINKHRYHLLTKKQQEKIFTYLKRSKFLKSAYYLKLLSSLNTPLLGTSLGETNTKISIEWHPSKNGPLTPRDVTPYSAKKVWWLCKKGHEWQSTIYNRSNGCNCPFCANKSVTESNSLRAVNPKIAKQWHPTKNGSLTPEMVSAGSDKKVWWQCNKGHEWKTEIYHRKNRGCPYCSNRSIDLNNCLATTNPKLAQEWHPTRNGVIKPTNVPQGSNKKVWWLCNHGHEWQAQIIKRADGRGCPYCANKAVCKDNCLKTTNPSLAQEWHPKKNGALTPENVTGGSKKRIWWQCKAGHEWQAAVYSRNKGIKCPLCFREKMKARK